LNRLISIVSSEVNKVVNERRDNDGSNASSGNININKISDKTEAFGVEVSKNSEDFWNKINQGWQQQNQNGLVAYRRHGDNVKTFSADTVNEGWIGNPFST